MLPRRNPPPSKVTAEERRLERERIELLKKEAELKRQLKNLPKQIEQKRAKEERIHTLRNVAATTMDLRGSRTVPSADRRRKTPKRELNSAKVRFMVLLMILLTILVMLWRAVPS